MAGLTPTGLVIKRFAELDREKKARAVQRFLDLVPPGDTVDTSNSSALGRLISLSIPSEADLWEAVQQVYDSRNPKTASGISLDDVVSFGSIVRFQDTRSTVSLILRGDVGTVITSGSVISGRSGTSGTNRFEIVQPIELTPLRASGVSIQVAGDVEVGGVYEVNFTTSNSYEVLRYTALAGNTKQTILGHFDSRITSEFPAIDSLLENNSLGVPTLTIRSNDIFIGRDYGVSGNMYITKVEKSGEALSEEFGPIAQGTNTLTEIVTPLLGWDSVYNPLPAIEGRYRESDEALRERFRVSKYERATNILEALYTALQSVPEVREVMVYENDTDTIDENGLPPHSFMPIVVGGIGTVLAETIWKNKPLGIASVGNTYSTIIDSQGFSRDIYYERPNPVNIFISIRLSVDGTFPQGGSNLIREELVKWVDSMSIGDDIVYSRVFSPINNIKGHQIDELFIGTSPNPTSTSNITVGFNQQATLSPINVVIDINQ